MSIVVFTNTEVDNSVGVMTGFDNDEISQLSMAAETIVSWPGLDLFDEYES